MNGFLHSARFHQSATLVWLALLVPTLIWWKDSITWVALMSLYANVVGHWSAYQAARAEENNTSRQHSKKEKK